MNYLFVDRWGVGVTRNCLLPIRKLIRVPASIFLSCPSGWGLWGHHLQPLGDGGSIVVKYHVVVGSPVIYIPTKRGGNYRNSDTKSLH
jgi:hypothetical protein